MKLVSTFSRGFFDICPAADFCKQDCEACINFLQVVSTFTLSNEFSTVLHVLNAIVAYFPLQISFCRQGRENRCSLGPTELQLCRYGLEEEVLSEDLRSAYLVGDLRPFGGGP